jgi:hypothetical protein
MCPQAPRLSPEYSHKAGLQTVITGRPLQIRPVMRSDHAGPVTMGRITRGPPCWTRPQDATTSSQVFVRRRVGRRVNLSVVLPPLVQRGWRRHRAKGGVFAFAPTVAQLLRIFLNVTLIVNNVCGSCKRMDVLLDKHRKILVDKLNDGEISSGRGQNQETSLARPGDTRWGSHYKTLLRIETMWESIIEVLGIVNQGQRNPSRGGGLVANMESFCFVLIMKMMLQILRITNKLSLLLQKKDQNIVQAMFLVDVRIRLNDLGSEGWDPLFEEVKAFCVEAGIDIPDMDGPIPRFGQSRRGRNNITQDHFYRVDIFYSAIDSLIAELDHRFNEVSSELLTRFACLDPRDSFSKFDVNKLARLTEIYLEDFSFDDRKLIKDQLLTFIVHVRRVDEFKACHDLASLAKTMVEIGRDIVFPLVYRLIELALLLPVAMATVERVFSATKIIKTELRNKMGDYWLNDLMVIYIERELFKGLDLQNIKKAFQKNKDRQMQLPRSPRHI